MLLREAPSATETCRGHGRIHSARALNRRYVALRPQLGHLAPQSLDLELFGSRSRMTGKTLEPGRRSVPSPIAAGCSRGCRDSEPPERRAPHSPVNRTASTSSSRLNIRFLGVAAGQRAELGSCVPHFVLSTVVTMPQHGANRFEDGRDGFALRGAVYFVTGRHRTHSGDLESPKVALLAP